MERYPSPDEDLKELIDLVATSGSNAILRAYNKLVDDRAWAAGRIKVLEAAIRRLKDNR